MSDEVSIPPAPSYRLPLQQRRRNDPARRMRLMVAGSLAAVVVAWFAGSALIHGRGRGVPTVQAESGPMRVKPTNPGGLQVAGADNTILSGVGSGEDRLAPPPQKPDLQALRAPAPPPPAPKPVEPPRLAAVPPPPAAASAPAVEPPKPAAAVKPVAAADEHKGMGAAADRRPAPSMAHSASVQLVALTSEHAAHEEWELLAKRMPQLLAGKQPAVSKIEHDGHTWWRLRTGGFADTAQATTFCMRLRAKGASCSVAEF